ncbi:MAG: DsbA family protein [Lachnospiraceae bacterium]|nr:DsbA family protein [Lachnospiraceae bacterium]
MKEIVFVTDFVCPYCLVAKAALEEALKEMGIAARIRMQPLELTEEPKARVDTYHDEKRKSRYQILEVPAKQLGLNMKFPPAVSPRPYTRLAFEGWYFAAEKGCGDAYSDLIYRAYFIDEKDIGELEVLAELAGSIGLDQKEFREALMSGIYSAREKEAVSYSKNVLKVSGVPAVYIDGEKIEIEEYTKEEMVRILFTK